MNQNEVKGLIAHRIAQLNRIYLKIDYLFSKAKDLDMEIVDGIFLLIHIRNEHDYKNVKEVLGFTIEKSEPDCYDSLYWCREDPDIHFGGMFLWGLNNP